MDKELREITEPGHDCAQAHYALALDAQYHRAVGRMSKSSVTALRHYALAVLGSPYLRVTNRNWSDEVVAWLATLERGDCSAAQLSAKGDKTIPANEPPNDNRVVMAYCSCGPTDGTACWLFVQFIDGVWYMDNLDFTVSDVIVWQELPPVPKETK